MCVFLTNPILRNKTSYDVIGLIERVMQTSTEQDKNQMSTFLFDKIHMPKAFLKCHIAMHHQTLGQYDAAVKTYLELKDYQTADRIFTKHIAPLYFEQP